MVQIPSSLSNIRWKWVFAAFSILLLIHLAINQDHGFSQIHSAVCNSQTSLSNTPPPPPYEDDRPASPKLPPGPEDPIPNIVHYIWVRKDAKAGLQFQFKHFVSAYSAYLYFNTDAIYIHTDASEAVIVKAREHGDYWTRKVLTIPGMTVRHVEVPTHAKNGMELKGVEHRSDFVRPPVMLEFGGIYMDFDVLPIRDVAPLRASGYNNVLGHELYEGINNGVWMSKPGNVLMKLFNDEQHVVYDGEWTTHSVQLLTHIANAVVGAPREVLILERKAFNPTAWMGEDFEHLFKPHPETKPPALTDAEADALFPPQSDIETLYKNVRDGKKEEWELDFSSSYVVHAMSPTHHGMMPEGFKGISLEYILARNSNYAKAAFPAIWHALSKGVITKDELL